MLRRLNLHGQNHTKCTQFGPCNKIVFHRLCFLKTEYYPKKVSFLPFVPFRAFFRTAENKKNYKKNK